MNIINHKSADQFGCDSKNTDFKLYRDTASANEEILLSDVIRTSNVGDNRVLNNSIKSPFQTFSKEGESVQSRDYQFSERVDVPEIKIVSQDAQSCQILRHEMQEELLNNNYEKSLKIQNQKLGVPINVSSYDEDMIRKPKSQNQGNAYNQSSEKRKEKVQFKIIKHATQSSKHSRKNNEESKSFLVHQKTHKQESKKYGTLDVPDFNKQKTFLHSEDVRGDQNKNFLNKMFDLTGEAFSMFGNILRKESPMPVVRDSLDGFQSVSAQGKPPLDKRINNIQPSNSNLEFEFAAKSERVDSMVEVVNRATAKQRGVSSNHGSQNLYTQKQLNQIKSQTGIPQNSDSKLILIEDILKPQNEEHKNAKNLSFGPSPANKTYLQNAKALQPSPKNLVQPSFQKTFSNKLSYGLENKRTNQYTRFSKSGSSQKVMPFTHKSRYENSSSNVAKYYGKDKLDSGHDQNLTNFSDATTNPSPNPPHFMGMTTGEALQKYKEELTMFEKTELSQFEQIYTIGSIRREALSEVVDGEGYYKCKIGEQIGYRYQVAEIVDKGAFGQVVKCFDMREQGKEVAIKISRNKKFDVDNAMVEVRILETLKQKDSQDKYGVVKLLDNFNFRRHMVLVFELLGQNLYRYVRKEGFKGLRSDHLRPLAQQILTSLSFLKKVGVIHCDLKPENILFTDDKYQQVKVIDFGSSCFNFKTGFTYVQSRYYRAPEILLGLPYSQAADMWSFGCIIAELTTGKPLFPALDENELLELFIMIIGQPSYSMIEKAKKKSKFFDKDMKLIRSKHSRLQKNLKKRSFPLKEAVYTDGDLELLDFLEKCLMIDPDQRITPEEALKHPWITSNESKNLLRQNDDIVQSVMSGGLSNNNKNKGMNRVASTNYLGTQFLSNDESKMTWDDVRNSEISDGQNTRNKPQAIIKQ